MRGKKISLICVNFCGISQKTILCICRIPSEKSTASLGWSFTVMDTEYNYLIIFWWLVAGCVLLG
jgi:hypothetical protein